jgi:hypothetical protein
VEKIMQRSGSDKGGGDNPPPFYLKYFRQQLPGPIDSSG